MKYYKLFYLHHVELSALESRYWLHQMFKKTHCNSKNQALKIFQLCSLQPFYILLESLIDI